MVRRVLLTVFALAVLLPSMALARTQFLCDSDLVVRDSCCCPPKRAKAPLPAPAFQRECCQRVKHVAVLPPAATTSGDEVAPVALAVVTTSPVIEPVRDLRLAVIPRAQAPPLERSLFSQHAALLL